MVTFAFHQQLRVSIADGEADPHTITWILSALRHLDPFRATDGFEWMTEILNSKYPEESRHQMSSSVMRLLGKEIDSHPPEYFPPEWVPPLLDFLLLSEKFYTEQSALDAGLAALRILSRHQVDAVFGPQLLPILTSTLLQIHPLRSRGLALKVFHRFASRWLSPQMKTVSDENLSKLLRAVGDPFKYLDLSPQYGQPMNTTDYDPLYKSLTVAVILIDLASSDLWRDHLNRSNFDSCENVLSTEGGRRAALNCMIYKATHTRPAFLCTPANIIAAIRRLEELRCSKTAEVVILWAWTSGAIDAADHDGWKLIGDDTLRFYRTHGMERLTTLKRHIDDYSTVGVDRQEFLLRGVDSVSSGVWQHPSAIAEQVKEERLIGEKAVGIEEGD